MRVLSLSSPQCLDRRNSLLDSIRRSNAILRAVSGSHPCRIVSLNHLAGFEDEKVVMFVYLFDSYAPHL